MRMPKLDSMDEFKLPLAQMVAKTSYLPHPHVVKLMEKAVFPTFRKRQNRCQEIIQDGKVVGMYDDNATPQWALFWTHEITGTRPKGWTIAHVWPNKDDINSYTHLANLILIPECFASLTDKLGPMVDFLRWHSWSVYGWRPISFHHPKKPEGFEQIKWRYFSEVTNPTGLLQKRLNALNNQRVRVLRPVMKNLGMI